MSPDSSFEGSSVCNYNTRFLKCNYDMSKLNFDIFEMGFWRLSAATEPPKQVACIILSILHKISRKYRSVERVQ